jgi:hypothetical protein
MPSPDPHLRTEGQRPDHHEWRPPTPAGRQRTFDRLYDRFLPNKYDPPSFALKLGHKDMRLATEPGRELGVPMRLANMAFAEMTEALNGVGRTATPAHPRCCRWNGVGSRSKLMLGGFKRLSSAIRCTMAAPVSRNAVPSD